MPLASASAGTTIHVMPLRRFRGQCAADIEDGAGASFFTLSPLAGGEEYCEVAAQTDPKTALDTI